MTGSLYREDLAWIHHAGWSDFSRQAAPGLLELLEDAGLRNGRVVDVGCGGGLWLLALAEAGFEAIGIEPSPTLAALARKTAPPCEVLERSAYDGVLPEARAITAIGEVLSYFEAESRPPLESFFECCAKALEEGGLIVFDVIVEASGTLDAKTWWAEDDWAILIEVREPLEDRCVIREITTFRRVGDAFRRRHETHRQAVYRPVEVERALRAAGFESVLRLSRYGALPMLPRRQGFSARRGRAPADARSIASR